MLGRIIKSGLLRILRPSTSHDLVAALLEELLPAYVERETDFDRLNGLLALAVPRFAERDPDKRRVAGLVREALERAEASTDSADALVDAVFDGLREIARRPGSGETLTRSLAELTADLAADPERILGLAAALDASTIAPTATTTATTATTAGEADEDAAGVPLLEILLPAIAAQPRSRERLSQHVESLLPDFAKDPRNHDRLAASFAETLPEYVSDPAHGARIASLAEALLRAFAQRNDDAERLTRLAELLLPRVVRTPGGPDRVAAALEQALPEYAADPEHDARLGRMLLAALPPFAARDANAPLTSEAAELLFPAFAADPKNQDRIAEAFERGIAEYADEPDHADHLRRILEALLLAEAPGTLTSDLAARIVEVLLPRVTETREGRERLIAAVEPFLGEFADRPENRAAVAAALDRLVPPFVAHSVNAADVAPILAAVLPALEREPEVLAAALDHALPELLRSEPGEDQLLRAIESALPRMAEQEDRADRVADLLTEILPAFARWSWGTDTVMRRHFNRWQSAGFNLTPNHHYFPIPDVGRIAPELDRRSALPGIDLREEAQLALLEDAFAPCREELSAFAIESTEDPTRFHLANPTFRHVDAHALHCFVRHFRPRRMVEVGSGYSTLVSAAACRLNRQLDDAPCEFVAIEPYPSDLFRNPVPGLTRLIEETLQEAGLEPFERLEANDVLFIDSTHVLTTGSDVALLYLEVLPRLRPGVIVHVHDIFLPGEYPRKWIEEEHIFWNEQYVLQAFLAHNREWEVLFAASYMNDQHPDELRRAIPGYEPEAHSPGSFWIRRVA